MRLTITNTKNDSILYIIDSKRIGKKITSKVILNCGKLSELKKIYSDPITHFKEIAKKMSLEEKEKREEKINILFNPQKRITGDVQCLFNAGYLFLQKLYYGLKLDKTCKKIMENNKAEFDLNKILKDLVFSRIIYPSSKLSTFELASKFLEQPNYELHDVYRALDVLSDNIDLFQAEVYKNSPNVSLRDTSVLYYDCTNFFFETEVQDGFRNYGISKEHRPNPIVQMGLFMDGNGIPLAFNINKGNTSEQVTPRPTEEMIEKDFGLSKFIFCSDAGLGSYNNRWFNQLKNRSFIITQSLKKLKGFLLDWALEDSGWNDNKTIATLDSDERLYKSRSLNEEGLITIDGIPYKTTINQRLIITYSAKYAAYQRNIRDSQIERAGKLLKHPASFDKHTSNDFKRLIKNIRYDKNGEIINNDLTIDYDLIAKEERFDGFYALVTNLEDEDKKVVDINHNRWEIEESFRIMKTDFKSRPVYLRNENRIRAHFLTCYLALLIFRIVEQKINTDNNHFTSNEIITALRDMNLFNQKNEGFSPAFTLNPLVLSLEKSFDLYLDFEIISSKKKNFLLASSKK